MKGLDDHEDGLNDAAWERALNGGRKRKRTSRKAAQRAAADPPPSTAASVPLVEARRVFTGTDACMVCGRPEAEHGAPRIDRPCPVTADSLTPDQVDRWWRAGGRGGSFVDALDASPELRGKAEAAGLYYPAPSAAQATTARTRIATALNHTA
jgi:hypothetical protein